MGEAIRNAYQNHCLTTTSPLLPLLLLLLCERFVPQIGAPKDYPPFALT